MSGDWRNLAACRGLDPDLFFAERGDAFTVRNARAVCATCPVAAEYLEYAIANDETVGMWGGLCGDELIRERRRRARTTPPSTPRTPFVHGVEAGWYKHRRLGEEPCTPCRVAHNAASNARKAARREAAA